MGTLTFYLGILHVLLLLQADETNAQSSDLFLITSGQLTVCRDFAGTEPSTCGSGSLATTFPGVTGTPLKMELQNCGGVYSLYGLFDGAMIDQIYRILALDMSTPSPILDPSNGFTVVTNFALCCDTVVFANGDDVYVQNLSDQDAYITKLLFTSTSAIDHLEISCNPDEYYVFHSINGDGLYRTGMDGSGTTMVVRYDGGESIIDLDFNSANGYFGFGVLQSLYMWDYATHASTGASFPVLFSSLTAWYTRSGSMITSLTVGSTVGSSPLMPNIITAWGSASPPLVYVIGMSTATDITSQTDSYVDIFVCLDGADCTIGCGSNCPCDQTDDFQDCCEGLCVSRNEVNDRSYSCFCRVEEVFTEESCTTNVDIPTYPTSCPIDLIGAVKCHGSRRTETSFLYALSTFSKTNICATDVKGENQPFPRGAIPIPASNFHSSGYKFLDQRFLGKGDQYGIYTVMSSNCITGMPTEQSSTIIDSFSVILQERNEAIFSNKITVRAVTGDKASIEVAVARQCDKRRIRWKRGGTFLPQYKGKTSISFNNVQESDFGVYEAYLQGRIKRNWRFIIRLVPSLGSSACGAACLTNGGVCSYNDLYCICPPGKVGLTCESTCTAGTFGQLGECGYSCKEEFGDDAADCQYILFCLEDPFGCQCYPGYELPYCTPCSRGFWGTNCENECSCGSTCDAYDGTCPK